MCVHQPEKKVKQESDKERKRERGSLVGTKMKKSNTELHTVRPTRSKNVNIEQMSGSATVPSIKSNCATDIF